jgi:hypothetical protein
MTPADPFAWSLAKRAAVAIATAACLAAAIVMTTDEATSTAGMRIARLAAIGPLLACLGVLAVCAHARLRGEIGALEALGMAPWEASRGAALAGWMFCFATLVLLALPWVDPESLFPKFSPPIDWVMDPNGAAARSASATVLSDGAIEIGTRAMAHTPRSAARWAALACLAPIAFCVPAWAVTPMRASLRVASLLAAAALLLVVLHAVGAGRVSGGYGVFAALPLFASLVVARRGLREPIPRRARP